MPLDATTLQAALGPWDWSPEEWLALAHALGQRSRPAVRWRDGQSPDALPFAVEPVPWSDVAGWVDAACLPSQRLAYATGAYYVQDAASLLPLMLLDLPHTAQVLDLCASPGGKATALAERLTEGWLVANEAVRARLPALEFNLARHGASRYAVTARDPDELARYWPGEFCAVLVDAPCSGQSLVAKSKQSAAAFSPRQVEHCALRQRRILEAAVQLVRPGGRLVYSTCTFAPAENEDQIAWLLSTFPGWRLHGCPRLQPWESPRLPETYRLWPHRDGCLGGFAACLERSPQAEGSTGRLPRPRLQRQRLPEELKLWGDFVEPAAPIVMASEARMFSWSVDPGLDGLLANADGGPELAFRKGRTWFPSYALAMRRDPTWRPAQRWELDEAAALAFVQGAAVPCKLRGWAVACWQGQPLGWCKADGRLGKNHLPKAGWLNRPAV